MNLQEHIRRYLELVQRADHIFETVRKKHPDLIICRSGCDDCCSVYFQLSFIEAFYLSGLFKQSLEPSVRERVMHQLDLLEPHYRNAEALLAGAEEQDKIEIASKLKTPCPLNEGHGCVLYEHRPITCRLYGIPQKIGNKVISCPNNFFRRGENYVTVDIDEIQKILHGYSRDFLIDLIGVGPKTPFTPTFSMPNVLKTNFDRNFFLDLREALQ